MNAWVEWFRTHLHWFVFILLEAASLVMLFRFNSYHSSVWFTQTNAVAGRVLSWEQNFHDYLQLKQINAQLVQENTILQYNNRLLMDELNDAKHDSTYVETLMAEHLKDVEVIPAHIVSNSVRMKDNIITIDRGRLDGVRNEMGVVSGTGVVGIIYEVSDHYSLVLPILNSKSNISCRLRGTAYFGSLVWKGGSVLDAYIDDIPRHAQFKVGDIVETSGYSSVFPSGIFIGKVSEVHNSPDGMSYELKVRLSTDLAKLRDVSVINNPDQAELDTLRVHGQKDVRE